MPGWREPISAELDDLYERMSHFLEAAAAAPAPTAAGLAWTPLADLSETEDAYVLEVDVPGVRREDMDIQVSERELTITGELKEREREGNVRHRTRRTGRFEYRALLPEDVKAEDVSATLEDGVLTLTIPKAKAAKPRHIEIKSRSKS